MRLRSVCLVTADVARLREFYRRATGAVFTGDDGHSTARVGETELVLYRRLDALAQMGIDLGPAPAGGTAWLTFEVDDPDRLWSDLGRAGLPVLGPPVTHPWGARSFQVRDPDGNVVGFVRPPSPPA